MKMARMALFPTILVSRTTGFLIPNSKVVQPAAAARRRPSQHVGPSSWLASVVFSATHSFATLSTRHQRMHNIRQALSRLGGSSNSNNSNNSNNNTNNTKTTKKTFRKKGDRSLLRADRVLSNRGWGTRSECTTLLKQKRVSMRRKQHSSTHTHNDDSDSDSWTLVKGPSEQIRLDAPLRVDHRHDVPIIPLLLVFHKPKWVLSVMSDPKKRRCVKELLSSIYIQQNLHPVGRLDYDTSGLLLFSSNGQLTQTLLHPSHEIEKEYVAIVEGAVDATALQDQLQRGVKTTEGTHTAKLLNVTVLDNPTTVQQIFDTLRKNLPPEYNVTDLEERGFLAKEAQDKNVTLSRVRLVVSEGKHRMVRRMLANCGHGVVELKRERQGAISLKDLPEGQFRTLSSDEETWASNLFQ